MVDYENTNYMEYYEALISVWIYSTFDKSFNGRPLDILINSLHSEVMLKPNELLNVVNELRFIPDVDDSIVILLNAFENHIRNVANIQYTGIMPKSRCFVAFDEYCASLGNYMMYVAYNFPSPQFIYQKTLSVHLHNNRELVVEAARTALNFLLGEEDKGKDTEEVFLIIMEYFNSIR